MTSKGQRKANGSFELAETPSHLLRRCNQYYGDLYAQEAGARDLTKQQLTVLAGLEHHEGASQTALVEMTGIDRSTLAEMVRRMLDRGLLSRERTEEDARANAVAITQGGRKALRSARLAQERAEKKFMESVPLPERPRLLKILSMVVAAADAFATNGDDRRHRKAPRGRRN